MGNTELAFRGASRGAQRSGVARTQSRRTVSIPRELYDLLARLRDRHRISASQLVGQAVWALIRGRIEVAPARSPYQIGLETYALRATLAETEEREAWEARAVDGTCAICGEPHQVAAMPLDRVGPEYPTCWSCSRPAPMPRSSPLRSMAWMPITAKANGGRPVEQPTSRRKRVRA